MLYRPRMIIILQGHKVGYLSDFTFRYDPEHYLMTPCRCPASASASPPRIPLVGLSVEIDVAALQALLLEMGTRPPPRRNRVAASSPCPSPRPCSARWSASST